MKKITAVLTQTVILLFLLFHTAPCADKVILDFNEKGAAGVSWPGWTWYPGGANGGANDYGDAGWRFNGGKFMTSSTSNWMPRLQSNNGYGQINLATIDTANRAPSTFTGGSLKVYDASDPRSTTGSSNAGSNLLTVADASIFKIDDRVWVPGAGYTVAGRVGAIDGNVLTILNTTNANVLNATKSATGIPVYHFWMSSWYYFTGENYGTSRLADSTTNRMDFYLKTSGLVTDNQLTTSKPQTGNFHVGTYLCWTGGGAAGQNCPVEANAQHYYHYLTIRDGAWIHVQLDSHPTHQRGMSGANEPGNNPAFALYGKHYFENMNAFYAEIRYPQPVQTSYWIDEIKLSSAPQEENDLSVNTVWVGYWPDTKKWEIGFMDDSFNSTGYNATSQSSFEVRYSSFPITNDNWDKATPVVPEYWKKGTTNAFVRPDPWSKVAWTRFTLPAGLLDYSRIFFAVKDVSSVSAGDGHNSPSAKVKTIDYSIKPSPNNLRRGA